MPTTESIRHRLDPAHCAIQLGRVGRQRPAAEELDLHHTQAGVRQHGLHPRDVEPGRHRPRQVVGVQPDSGESRRCGCSAPLDERVPRFLSEAGPGQREEARDQLEAAGVVSHGRQQPRS
jgi:hypothetical protein